jgi:sugar/nucleoside kinase (ribokinase family)
MYDVSSICNALVDVMFKASDNDLKKFNLSKGKMCLTSKEEQEKIIAHFPREAAIIQLGGSCLNTIRALSTMKANTFFSGVVNNDEFGEKIREQFSQLNISDDLHITNKENTGSCVVLVTPDGERSFSTYLGASRLFDKDMVPSAAIKNSKIFHFCGYQWDTEKQKESMWKALKVAKDSNIKISFDVADPFVVEKNKDDFRLIIKKYADITFANRQEAQMLYGLDPNETANKIASYGGIAVVKLDSDGSILQKENESVHIPAKKVTVIDTTGAGDMFSAGFIYGWLNKKSLKECGTIGTSLASDVVGHYGAITSSETLYAAKSFIA